MLCVAMVFLCSRVDSLRTGAPSCLNSLRSCRRTWSRLRATAPASASTRDLRVPPAISFANQICSAPERRGAGLRREHAPSRADVSRGGSHQRPLHHVVERAWKGASSEAAQLFHFDMDRIRFLKVFIYLTDVGTENGPHVYVRGSHRSKPPAFFRDRRFSDAEVKRAFPPTSVNSPALQGRFLPLTPVASTRANR